MIYLPRIRLAAELALLVVAVAAVAYAVHVNGAARSASQADQKMTDEGKLVQAGAVVPAPAPKHELEQRVDRAGLRSQADAVRAAVPTAETTTVIEATSRPAVAHGTEVPSAHPGGEPSQPSPCLLRAGDEATIHAALAEQTTSSGARAWVGRLFVVRAIDGQAILEQQVDEKATTVTVTTVPPKPPIPTGWGVGLAVGASSSAVHLAGAVSPPLRPIWKGRATFEQVYALGVEQGVGGQRGAYADARGIVRF